MDENTTVKIDKGREVECRNSFFGFDGYRNEH